MGKNVARAVTDRRVLGLIKQVVLEEAGKLGVRVERVILFGSRARGDYREDSDYDILVVVLSDIDRGTRRELARRVRMRLVWELRAPVDVIVTSLDKWRRYRGMVGHLFYSVEREGIPACLYEAHSRSLLEALYEPPNGLSTTTQLC